jgi:hypothetical protein
MREVYQDKEKLRDDNVKSFITQKLIFLIPSSEHHRDYNGKDVAKGRIP